MTRLVQAAKKFPELVHLEVGKRVLQLQLVRFRATATTKTSACFRRELQSETLLQKTPSAISCNFAGGCGRCCNAADRVHPHADGVIVSPSQSSPITTEACPLSEDPFALTVIQRKVQQLLTFPEFEPYEDEDLQQELMSQLDSAMKDHRDDVGHRNPYIVMVIERKASNLLEYRRQILRAKEATHSLNVQVRDGDGNSCELIQTISESDQRRRLEFTTMPATDQFDLQQDIKTVIASLPEQWQTFLRLRSEHTLTAAAEVMGVPRSTAKSWVPRIAEVFEEAGLRDYQR